MAGDAEILNSWKEIAQYLGRGVRTVQRWERDMNLPVRRPRGKSRSAVIALRRELDDWLNHRPKRLLAAGDGARHVSLTELRQSTEVLHKLAADLAKSSAILHERMERAIELANRRNSALPPGWFPKNSR